MRVASMVVLASLWISFAGAQHQHQHAGMHAPKSETASDDLLLMHQASGTSSNPASAPMPMIHLQTGSWKFMMHGSLFVSEIQQTGPRGRDKFVSTSWFMGSAERRIGRDSLMLRSMLSLDPATVTNRRYPLLFQTGETAFGKPLVDAQHPHDFFMELSVQYTRPIGERTAAYIYFAPVGDPALGPVAFPHRVSAAEIPQATLSHHVQDSTHIANEVITAGVAHGIFRVEASGFHGAEPNENRWNIDRGGIDSWSARLTVSPTPNWSGQVSAGSLAHPEALEPNDIVRSTASLTYSRPLHSGHWATSLIWGRNHKNLDDRDVSSYVVESVLQFRRKNYLTGRIEAVDKDELFDDRPEIKQRLERTVGGVFRVVPYTIGYTRDIHLLAGLQTGLGANLTLYSIPSAIQPFYGDRPLSFLVYLRIRLQGEQLHHHSMGITQPRTIR